MRSGDQVHLLTPGAHYRARFLVGADGASGQVRRLCAAGSWFSQGFALEVQTALPREEVDLTFDFASVSNGYAWIFPKGDHLNVGVYSLSSAASLTRSRLLSYVQNRLGTEYSAWCYRAISGDRRRRDSGRICSAGFTGSRFLGGRCRRLRRSPDRRRNLRSAGQRTGGSEGDPRGAAGRGSAREAFASYLTDYRQTLRFSSRAAAAFYANPARGFRAMRLPFVRRSLVRTYTHGLNVKSLTMRIALSHC